MYGKEMINRIERKKENKKERKKRKEEGKNEEKQQGKALKKVGSFEINKRFFTI